MAYGETHNEHILRFIVGDEKADVIIALQKAVYLVMDATLKDKVKAPEAFEYLRSKYDIGARYTWEGIVSPESVYDHQYYSHLGWDHDYNDDKEPNKQEDEYVFNNNQRFFIKKEILISVVGKLYPQLSPVKINSFSAMLYYLHILGDFRHNEKGAFLMPLAKLSADLKTHLEILFGEDVSGLISVIDSNLTGAGLNTCPDRLDNVLDALFSKMYKPLESIEVRSSE